MMHVGSGAKISFGSWEAEILDLTPPTRETIDVTSMGCESSSFQPMHVMSSEFSLELSCDNPSKLNNLLSRSEPFNCDIKFPEDGSSCSFTGFLTRYEPNNILMENRMTVSIGLQVIGDMIMDHNDETSILDMLTAIREHLDENEEDSIIDDLLEVNDILIEEEENDEQEGEEG